ncbi:uncharacterized protein I206_107800 [Kwoniella pini CBS 10737]|uniref:Uncharacterized protein n=1 Tax=Kwoniella pini CBS 10737 TaxID=1296096 RepID=A0A1B9HYB3_9TREE|nr:uncharacterized protein I206_06133 [Kwoniella pini CBS 10737]OCF48265.1 hypothetical protein I206_06133 [Kwoniella pini CBS 10737]
MALILVGAGVRAGVKAYKAYDKKQKEKKEGRNIEDNASYETSNIQNMERLQLNEPSYPSQSDRMPSYQSESQMIPQGYMDEKKSREYEGHQKPENPFDAPPSYDKAIEPNQASISRGAMAAPAQERYTGGFGPSGYTPNSQNQISRTRSNSSSSSSSSSSSDSSKELRNRNPGLSRSELKALKRQYKYDRKLARRQAKSDRRAAKAQYRAERDMMKHGGVGSGQYGRTPMGMGMELGRGRGQLGNRGGRGFGGGLLGRGVL